MCFSNIGYASYLEVPSLLETATLSEGTLQIATEHYLLTQKLETVVTEVLYGGDTEDVTYSHTATEGFQYLLVLLEVQPTSSQGVNTDEITLTMGEHTYHRIQDDAFLSNHHFAPLSHGDTASSKTGWVVFEIPNSITETNVLELGNIVLENQSFNLENNSTSQSNIIEQVPYVSYLEKQKVLDNLYEKNIEDNNYTVNNPYIVVNPYEIAPHSARQISGTR